MHSFAKVNSWWKSIRVRGHNYIEKSFIVQEQIKGRRNPLIVAEKGVYDVRCMYRQNFITEAYISLRRSTCRPIVEISFYHEGY